MYQKGVDADRPPLFILTIHRCLCDHDNGDQQRDKPWMAEQFSVTQVVWSVWPPDTKIGEEHVKSNWCVRLFFCNVTSGEAGKKVYSPFIALLAVDWESAFNSEYAEKK